MTFKQLFKGLDSAESERRMGIIVRLNILWDKLQKCDDEAKQKRIRKQIDTIRRQETGWMKDIAWFLY